MRRGAAVVVLVWIVLLAPSALADGAPWAQGVTSADQERATAMVTEANTLVSESPTAALEKYEAAIQVWDNPVFHYRMAVTLMQLGRDDDARAALKASLRFGAAPFTPDDYAQATSYQKMLDEKLHANDEVRDERRWPTWIPWTTLGVGGIGLIAGLGILSVAKSDENRYDEAIASQCAVNGCNLDDGSPMSRALNAQHDQAQTRMTVAEVTLGVGAAVLVTGIVLAVMNRPRAVRVDAKATAGGATASLGWDF